MHLFKESKQERSVAGRQILRGIKIQAPPPLDFGGGGCPSNYLNTTLNIIIPTNDIYLCKPIIVLRK